VFFTGKYTTLKIHTKQHPGLERHIFHIITGEDIDDFTDIKFVSYIVLKFVGVSSKHLQVFGNLRKFSENVW